MHLLLTVLDLLKLLKQSLVGALALEQVAVRRGEQIAGALAVVVAATQGDLLRRHCLCNRVLRQRGCQLPMLRWQVRLLPWQMGQWRLALGILAGVLKHWFEGGEHLLSLVVLKLGLAGHVHF